MNFSNDKLWAGTEGSYEFVQKAEAAMQARLETGAFVERDENAPPRLLNVQDGIGLIDIKGSLVNSDSPMLEYFGLTGYPEIRAALVAAAQDPEIKQILLDVDSGGGAVSGVVDTAALIRNINDNVKPVTTFADGAMASAAYWLGGSAGEVVATKTSMVGSIGVLAVHKEMSEAYKKEGIGVTVVRAGKEKALANSNEKLSEKGRQQIQQMVDASYEVFVDHVATMRGVTYANADRTMAQGQEFVGESAREAKLVDRISTFDAVVSDLKKKSVASNDKLVQNKSKLKQTIASIGVKPEAASVKTHLGDTIMAKKPLSEQEVAAIAAGVVLDAATEDTTPETPETTETTATTTETTAETTTTTEASTGTMQVLLAQLKEKDAALLEAGIKIAKLEEKLVDVEATHGPLVEIAAKALGNMQIALGGSAVSVEGMTAPAVLAEHKRVAAIFAAKFKVGGVSAVGFADGGESVKKPSFVATNMTQAQIRAIHGK